MTKLFQNVTAGTVITLDDLKNYGITRKNLIGFSIISSGGYSSYDYGRQNIDTTGVIFYKPDVSQITLTIEYGIIWTPYEAGE